jgi:hypothetical protein
LIAFWNSYLTADARIPQEHSFKCGTIARRANQIGVERGQSAIGLAVMIEIHSICMFTSADKRDLRLVKAASVSWSMTPAALSPHLFLTPKFENQLGTTADFRYYWSGFRQARHEAGKEHSGHEHDGVSRFDQ